MSGPPTAFPTWWFDRRWNLNEVCIIIATPYDTAYRWLQMVRATGLFFAEKRGREILFDAHELYTFRVLASFARAGIPVGPTQIRAAIYFAFGQDGTPRIPEGKLIQAAPESEFSVDAVRIFKAVMAATDPGGVNAQSNS